MSSAPAARKLDSEISGNQLLEGLMPITKEKDGFSVKAYRGDAKTLLAFNLPKAKTKNLAGFTIQIQPADQDEGFYLQNRLQFEDPTHHAQDAKLPPTSSFNAPIHKFRWVHVPGTLHTGRRPFFGSYTYTATPRYFDNSGSLQPINTKLSVAVQVDVKPFEKGVVEVGFTRGFTQSQAFVDHFGPKAAFRPKGANLLFDTSQVAGKNSAGEDYTFAEEYEWLGFTARQKIFDLASEVLQNKKLSLDVFAYDLNEPDLLEIFLTLAKEGRIRMILDDASLHHDGKPAKSAKPASPPKKAKVPKAEDQFERLFNKAAKEPAAILRGHFGRFAHDKVFIVKKDGEPLKVLSGSTNFSITGLYVNSNHILVFNNADVAATYAAVFNAAWDGKVSTLFNKLPEAGQVFSFTGADLPKMEITFSPHAAKFAQDTLDKIAARIAQEEKQTNGSVLFAVMGLDKATGPVLPALQKLHKDQNIFSYGISDSPGGIQLYTPRQKTGVLVSGKPAASALPPPFNQVPGVGLGHQVHHKFIVCGFNGPDPVVICGSSNLALKGEQVNGDNLLAIHDADVATVFAIDALTLVDHFDFLDRSAVKAKVPPTKIKSASKQQQAVKAGWFLSTNDRWAAPYYDSKDLKSVDRQLFG
jgi:phosphatidylserine/phosphatidylglycerophosphate/cardiolipin synthase-like enzyme